MSCLVEVAVVILLKVWLANKKSRTFTCDYQDLHFTFNTMNSVLTKTLVFSLRVEFTIIRKYGVSV